MSHPAAALLRTVLLIAAASGVLLFLLPMGAGIINIGNLFGLTVCLLLFICLLIPSKVHAVVSRAWSCRSGKITLSVIGVLAVLGVLYCLAVSILMARAACRKPKQEPQALIVLGCKVNGKVPSLMLSRRIQAAYDAMQQYPDIPVVVSGGQGDNEEISEADCMAETLIALGIAPERILRENQSRSTSENLRFSKKILDENGIRGQLLLVTDAYHQMRAQMLAETEQLPDCAPVTPYTSWYLLPTFWVREWFGVAHAIVFGN